MTNSVWENFRKLLVLLIIACWGGSVAIAQRILIHSHNDYRQTVPFYQAYAQRIYSFEADVFAGKEKDQLLVGHDADNPDPDLTLDDLYLQPIIKIFKQNGGKTWKDTDDRMQLMIDLKSPAEPALGWILKKLKAYPDVFDPSVNPHAVQVVISGNMPDPVDFSDYPAFISFDGRLGLDYTPEQLTRLALISAPFSEYARWNGKGSLKTDEKVKVQSVINQVHAMGKPVRFWGTPNSVTAWNTFHYMGVDLINTDRPEACADFFHDFGNKNFRITGNEQGNASGVTKTDRLDKTTSGFQGFDIEKLQLTKGIEIYQPTYRNDGVGSKVKNIIFLIGDGMGLAQIYAAGAVNNGLTLLNFKHIGLQTNTPKDAFTTDSAAGGSALATGKAHCNRHISMSETGEVYPSITDVAYDLGLACGVVTLGNLADATPAAFYGHTTERDDTDKITDWLLDGKLTLLNGSGLEVFTGREDATGFMDQLKKIYRITTDIGEINLADDPVICADSRMDLAATGETLDLLAWATREAITKLTHASERGFFLMVEGAKIDYAGHANSFPGSVVETLSFDLAIREALRFADSNGETLVVVTADHETGGLTLVDGDRNGLVTARYMTDDHTPVMLPVFAYGPGSSGFMGVYPNTQIFYTMKALLKAK